VEQNGLDAQQEGPDRPLRGARQNGKLPHTPAPLDRSHFAVRKNRMSAILAMPFADRSGPVYAFQVLRKDSCSCSALHEHYADAPRNELDFNAVAKCVWADALSRQRWYLFGGCLNILLELASYTCRGDRSAIAIQEDWLIVASGLAPQQSFRQIHRSRSQWADSGFPAFSKELHVGLETRTGLPEDTH
jgi:hypothetical protein